MNEEAAMRAFVEGMLRFSVKLVRAEPGILHVGDTGKVGKASGFIVPAGDRFRILSAAHALKRSLGWAVELLPVKEAHQTLMLGISEVESVATIIPKDGSDALDLAWTDIDVDKLRQQMKDDPVFQGLEPDLPVYYEPLDLEPDSETPYAFAAWNLTEFHPALSTLLRENSAELYMRYIGTDSTTGLYRFQLAREHQGHDYYRGASGSAIAGIDGRIVSMLVGGDRDATQNCLYGVPLKQYAERLLSPADSNKLASEHSQAGTS